LSRAEEKRSDMNFFAAGTAYLCMSGIAADVMAVPAPAANAASVLNLSFPVFF